MQAMVRHPTCGMPGTVEHCPENQKLLNDRIGPQGLVREHAVITHRSAKPAERSKEHCQAQNLETRQRKQNQSDDAKNVNQDQVSENAFFAVNRFPKRTVPGLHLRRLLRCTDFHVLSDGLRIEGAGVWCAETQKDNK